MRAPSACTTILDWRGRCSGISPPCGYSSLSITVYTIYGIASGHFRRKFTPIWPRQIIADLLDFLRGKLDHELGARNAVQKLLYTFAVLCMLLMVWSGLVLWKPVQFEELGIPLGNHEGARYVHFFGMAGLVGFIFVHIALMLLVPKVLPPMITGRALASAVKSTVAPKFEREHP